MSRTPYRLQGRFVNIAVYLRRSSGDVIKNSEIDTKLGGFFDDGLGESVLTLAFAQSHSKLFEGRIRAFPDQKMGCHLNLHLAGHALSYRTRLSNLLYSELGRESSEMRCKRASRCHGGAEDSAVSPL